MEKEKEVFIKELYAKIKERVAFWKGKTLEEFSFEAEVRCEEAEYMLSLFENHKELYDIIPALKNWYNTALIHLDKSLKFRNL